MSRWVSNNNRKARYRGFDDENDMLMGVLASPKSGMDLLQNCDLPPPQKVFSGSEKTITSSPVIGKEEERIDFDTEKLELLKALRLSQTRAREAEKKATILARERDCVANALLKESMQLFAHRQWVRMLDVQVIKFQSQTSNGDDDGVSWIMALAFCLGVAGVGFAFGYTSLF